MGDVVCACTCKDVLGGARLQQVPTAQESVFAVLYNLYTPALQSAFFVMQVFGVEVAAAKLHFAGVARVERDVTLCMAHSLAMSTE